MVASCYHMFDINFQGLESVQSKYIVNNNLKQAMMALSTLGFDDTLFLDARATHHLSQNQNNCHNVQPYQGDNQVTMDNGKKLKISNFGFKAFQIPHRFFHLQFTFHVPHLATNLISVSKFCHDNHSYFEFHPTFFCIKDYLTKKTLLQGNIERGLYKFPL